MLRLTLATALALHPSLTLACARPEPPRFDGGSTSGVSVSVGQMADLVWVPLVLDGLPIAAEAGLWLQVSFDGRVDGGTGCNRFTGIAELDAGVMEFGPLAVTEMACADPAAMRREAAYLGALAEVGGFVVSADGMWLTREDGSVAMCLW
ncbi:META domain-containing protein [Tabrizicola sp.]|uniref:META domain-containing protein n=1 Tax=Tabrizicola sp. TaxID=2005166 RepID=UPI00273529DB|nr:META domain-containing protein [Tabrizicola sp.]MDP3194883.1 META domain-containing protein [Tabrizicola sp.]